MKSLQDKKVTEYPILLPGLVIGILPVYFLSKNGTRHLLLAFSASHARHFSHGVMGIWFRRLLAGPWVGRSYRFVRALFERSELVRAQNVGVRPIPNGQTGRQWFWVLLPKQKGLACRGETRQHQKPFGQGY